MTLKYKQIGEYNGDIVRTILNNRGIENIHLFLNPDNSSDTNPFAFKNMVQGIQVLAAHLMTYSKMAVLVDSDADGFLSASYIYQYLKSIDPLYNIDFIIHDKKAHGLTEDIMERISEKNYELIIIPDAASNDARELDILYGMGVEVIVLDHHLVEEMPESGIIINNQISENVNTNLVGVGVVHKFCQAMDKALNTNRTEKLKDLVALGQISDASDISENEVRNLVFDGIKNMENKFIKEALKIKDIFQPVPKDLSFSVIPMINAVIRIGSMEEKEILFRALNDINPEIFTVEKRKKNKETKKFDKIQVNLNLQQMAVDIAIKCKTRQDTAVKKAVAQIEEDIVSDGGIAIGVGKINDNHASLTGLIATKMVNKLQKPVLILRERDGKFSGSGRGYDPTMDSFKDWCQDTGLVEFAQGHDQAFGIEIDKEKFDLFKTFRKKVEAREFIHEVDYVSRGVVDKEIIHELDRNKFIFGGKVHDSLFAYVGIDVEKKNIKQKGSMLTFYVDDVEFVMYGASQETADKFTAGFAPQLRLDFIGRPTINNWLGREATQVVLEAVEFSNEEAFAEEITIENIVF